MPFTSFAFVGFLAVVLAALYLIRSRPLQQWILLAASLVFYAYWKPLYLLVLAAPALIDYFCAIRIEESTAHAIRKRWLAVSMVSNLGLLAYFKYANWFLENIAAVFGIAPHHLSIVLPLGISFLTFRALSYTIDVYRGELSACRSLLRYLIFVSYFPVLIAGPIVRASVLLPQLGRSLRPSWSRAAAGAQIILLGVTKKLLIADQMAPFTDAVFAAPAAYSPLTVWSAAVAYALQIYCDFSGYSDMAIGISRVMGIELPENFNLPYLALSPADFWRRWHITFTQWLRDYLYFSLPGQRGPAWKRYRNIAITVLLGGLWHGANWTFVCWGALHGAALMLNYWWIARRGRREFSWPSGLVRWLGTSVFLCATWVLFRAANLSIALEAWRKMAALDPGGVAWFYSPLLLVLPLVVVGHVVGARKEEFSLWRQPALVAAFVATGWLLLVLLFGAIGSSPFIYFQF